MILRKTPFSNLENGSPFSCPENNKDDYQNVFGAAFVLVTTPFISAFVFGFVHFRPIPICEIQRLVLRILFQSIVEASKETNSLLLRNCSFYNSQTLPDV